MCVYPKGAGRAREVLHLRFEANFSSFKLKDTQHLIAASKYSYGDGALMLRHKHVARKIMFRLFLAKVSNINVTDKKYRISTNISSVY